MSNSERPVRLGLAALLADRDALDGIEPSPQPQPRRRRDDGHGNDGGGGDWTRF